MCTRMLMANLLLRALTWKQPKCLPKEKQIHKRQYVHTVKWNDDLGERKDKLRSQDAEPQSADAQMYPLHVHWAASTIGTTNPQ